MSTFYEISDKKRPFQDEEDEQFETYPPREKSFLRQCADGHRKWIGYILLLLIIVLLSINLYVLSDLDGIAWPWERSRVIHKAYGRDERFMSLDHKYDVLWDDVADANTAIIHAQAGAHSHNGAIGMFHALHCLWSFRHALQRARAGEDIGLDQHDDKHWPHCFDYLRQAILCAADDTIERAHLPNRTVVPDSDHGGFIEGRLDVRVCGDSERLYELKKLKAAE